MQDNLNGHQEADSVVLPPGVLKRLARLHARAEGAAVVAQAAVDTAKQAQESLQSALTEACEDEGMNVPAGANTPVDVDWRTGRVKLQTLESLHGSVPQPAPVPPPLAAIEGN